MAILYLCNIGVRDLCLDGQPLNPCRTKGEEALRDYDKLRDRFSAPIVKPGIDFVLKRHPRIDRLILFATDQPMDVDARFRDRDTVHTAEILRRLLDSIYNTKQTTRLREVKVKLVKEENPAQYDDMYSFYQRQMATRDLRLEGMERCYVVPAGGTPAANTGLILHAAGAFGDRCEIIAISEVNGLPQPLQIGDQLRTATKKEVISSHLAAGSFAEALAILEEIRAPKLACALAAYAKHRLFFDFPEAERVIVEASEVSSGAERRLCERLRGDLQALSAGSAEALLVELYHNAAITYAKQEYVDFLGRAFRFQEATLELVVKRIYGVDLDDDKPTHRARLAHLVEGNACLKAHMDLAKVGGSQLRYDRVNIPVLRELLCHAVQPNGGEGPDGSQLLDEEAKEAYRQIHAILVKMFTLEQLRNSCVISHGFKGVSQDILWQEYNGRSSDGTDPVSDMARVCALLGLEPFPGPYERIREAIEKEIERL